MFKSIPEHKMYLFKDMRIKQPFKSGLKLILKQDLAKKLPGLGPKS